MEIVKNSVEQRDTYQFVYFTLTDDSANNYQSHCRVPLGQDVDTYLTDNMNKMWRSLLGKRFPAIMKKYTVGETKMEPPFNLETTAEIEQWILDNSPEEVPWVSTHPDIYPASGIEASTLLTAIQDLVNSLSYDQIDTHIDNTFTSLTTGEKNSLKKVYKAVLYLAKKR
jgi:hypothetical protein